MKRKLLLFVLPLLSTFADSKEFSGTLFIDNLDTPYEHIEYAGIDVSMNIDTRITWKTWTMYQEPVVDSYAQWRLNSIKVKHNGKLSVYKPCAINKHKGCIPLEVVTNIGIIEADFAALSRGLLPYGFVLNSGAYNEPTIKAAKNGKKSYNTPASPNWNQFIFDPMHPVTLDTNVSDYKYLSEEEAKKRYKQGINIEQLKLIKFIGAYSDFVEHYRTDSLINEKSTIKKEAHKSEKAAIAAIRSSSDDDIFAAFEEEQFKEKVAFSQQFDEERASQKADELSEKLKRAKTKEIHLISLVRKRVDAHVLPSGSLVLFKGSSGRYGYKDSKGNIIVKPKYYQAQTFSEGLAAVSIRNCDRFEHHCSIWGYINTKGEEVIPPQFRGALKFREGLAPVSIEDCRHYKGCDVWGFVDKSGQFVIKPKYSDANLFGDGLAPVRVKEGWKYIDHSGNAILPGPYYFASSFESGKARVSYDYEYLKKRSKTTGCQADYAIWKNAHIDSTGKIISVLKNGYRNHSALCLRKETY